MGLDARPVLYMMRTRYMYQSPVTSRDGENLRVMCACLRACVRVYLWVGGRRRSRIGSSSGDDGVDGIDGIDSTDSMRGKATKSHVMILFPSRDSI